MKSGSHACGQTVCDSSQWKTTTKNHKNKEHAMYNNLLVIDNYYMINKNTESLQLSKFCKSITEILQRQGMH